MTTTVTGTTTAGAATIIAITTRAVRKDKKQFGLFYRILIEDYNNVPLIQITVIIVCAKIKRF